MSAGERCEKCGRPKATAHDVIRWLSGSATEACFDGADFPEMWIRQDEETADADTLRAKLAATRKRYQSIICEVASWSG